MSELDQSTQPPLVVVQRWHRYGLDRAYVRVDDHDAGYRDLNTGELVCPYPEHVRYVAEATDRMVKTPSTAEALAYKPRHAAKRSYEDKC